MPPTSSLNPAAGRITPNLVMAQVSTTGTVCLFTNVDVDHVDFYPGGRDEIERAFSERSGMQVVRAIGGRAPLNRYGGE